MFEFLVQWIGKNANTGVVNHHKSNFTASDTCRVQLLSCVYGRYLWERVSPVVYSNLLHTAGQGKIPSLVHMATPQLLTGRGHFDSGLKHFMAARWSGTSAGLNICMLIGNFFGHRACTGYM